MDNNNLVWMDLEMTGLDPDTDKVLELAVIVTDENLNILAEGPVVVLHQDEEVLAQMDEWNVKTHTSSGLIDKVRASVDNEWTCQNTVISFLQQYVPMGVAPLCGNSIWQDRRFIAKHLPFIDKYLHYRNIDVSSVKELSKRWSDIPVFSKKNCHEALSDIKESIAELSYYRELFFKIKKE